MELGGFVLGPCGVLFFGTPGVCLALATEEGAPGVCRPSTPKPGVHFLAAMLRLQRMRGRKCYVSACDVSRERLSRKIAKGREALAGGDERRGSCVPECSQVHA